MDALAGERPVNDAEPFWPAQLAAAAALALYITRQSLERLLDDQPDETP